MSDLFSGKTLLITGGTGSFGNAVTQRMLKSDIKEIRIFSRDEKKQDDMRRLYQNPKLKFYIGDVRRMDSILSAMAHVDYVFHAAALKQVPSCEFFPMEAVYTNIEGASNVMDAALTHGVKRVICLSTDKAVYPINAMGISKAMMEKVMVAKSRLSSETVLLGTRYGNVMYTRGSVIPIFVEQLKEGKELTLTDPNMTRYLMTLEDSVDLVLYAFAHGNPGDIFVQKAPACTTGDLAKAISELFSRDTGIKIIGTRHGEKLYESLLSREEMAVAEDLGDYYRVPSDNRDLNYGSYFDKGREEMPISEYSSENTERLDIEGIKKMLIKIPEIRNELGI